MDRTDPPSAMMKRSLLKFLPRVFCLAMIGTVVWLMYVVLFLHGSSFSKSILVFNRPHHLQLSSWPRKSVTESPVPKSIHASITSGHMQGKPFIETTVPISKDYDIKKGLSNKIVESKNDGKKIDDLSVNDHSSENKSIVRNVSSNAKAIVSKVQFVLSDKRLSQYESFFVPRKTVINNFTSTWLIQTTCPSKGPDLLIVVPSVVNHKVRRTAIRDTWGSPAYGHKWPGASSSKNDSIKLIFFLGISIRYNHEDTRSEAEAFGDIVVGDFADSYRNLSLKMALVLQWVHLHCPSANHVLKVDEDTFVNLPLLLDVLSLFSATHSSFVLGHKKPGGQPSVTRQNKRWRVSPSEYPLQYWPHYMYGHSYVISGDAIGSLLQTSLHLPLIPNEDAYVTGVLAKSAGVLRIHSWRMAIQKGVYQRCDLVNNLDISQTGFTTSLIYAVWETFKTGNCSEDH